MATSSSAPADNHGPESETAQWSQAAGFWSYVRDDNQADDDRILRLAAALKSEYEILAGDELELFVDRETLQWGEEWNQRITAAIAGTTFFIPIVTPRYLASSACRKELIQFAGKVDSTGLEELLLPVLYVSVPDLDADTPRDELAQLIKKTEWIDWRDHRLADAADSAVRRAVHQMATRLAEITRRVAQVPDVTQSAESRPEPVADDSDDEDEPGFVDILARGEAAMLRMNSAIDSLAEETNAVGQIMEDAAAEVARADSRGGGFAARLNIARSVAAQLEPRADSIEAHGRDFGAALMATDPAVHALLSGVAEELTSDSPSQGPAQREEALGYLRSVQELGDQTEEGIEHLRGFLHGLGEVATLSRDIKRPASHIEKGLQGMVDGKGVIEEWARRAAEIEQQVAQGQPGTPAG